MTAVRAEWRTPRIDYHPTQLAVLGPYKSKKVWRLLVGRGAPTSFDARQVAEHIETLRDMGFSTSAIAAAAGISDSAVSLIARGQHQTTQVRCGTRILAVTHHPVPAQTGCLVPGVGTQRRIQALNAIGWTLGALGEHLGVTARQVSLYARNRPVQYATWAAIRDMYDQLSGRHGAARPHTTRRYRELGYAPPIAWEGVDIDHPDSQPVVDDEPETPAVDEVLVARILAGDHHGEVPRLERAAVLDHAATHGWGGKQLATALNISRQAADRALVRRRSKIRQENAA